MSLCVFTSGLLYFAFSCSVVKMPQTRTESTCSSSSADEEILLFPFFDSIVTVDDGDDNKPKGKDFISLRERRQNKLGLRKVRLVDIQDTSSVISL